MSATRGLLEGQKEGKPGVNVDPKVCLCKPQFNGRTSPVEECFEYDFQLVKAENHTQSTPPQVMSDH